MPLLVSPSEQLDPTLVALRFGRVCVCPCNGPRVNLQVWLMGRDVSGIFGSGTAMPLLVRPSEQFDPTGAEIRLSKV